MTAESRHQTAVPERWSSSFLFYLSGVGAAVGLGSIWRFPYLAGRNGGGAFIFSFLVACLAIATPLLAAEFMLGRRSRLSPPEAGGKVAAEFGYSRRWNVIGILGTIATLLIMSYYTVIAGWVMAYGWKCLSGELTALRPNIVRTEFHAFLANPVRVGAWQLAFIALVGMLSGRGVNRGVEVANKIRAPALLFLLLVLVIYSLVTGDVTRGLDFAFSPDLGELSPHVALAAVGQAFFATGVGMGMMLAYGAYVPRGTSLMRSAIIISASIVIVSLLATLMIFPLVYRYNLNPAQGTELVFNVLPLAFARMPGGQWVGGLFFLLLAFAALTPTLAGFEPLVSTFESRFKFSRGRAVMLAATSIWLLGLGSVLSFNRWSGWHPLSAIPPLREMTWFGSVDYLSSNILLPLGALFSCVLIGWRLPSKFCDSELIEDDRRVRRAVRLLLRYLCPVAIVGLLVAGLGWR